MKKVLMPLILICVLFFSCTKEEPNILNITSFPDRNNDFTVWQIEQFRDISQMGYLIRTDDNKIIAIDGGSNDTAELLNDFIQQLGGTVNYWIITHPHDDHVGVLNGFLSKRNNIVIEKIVHSKIDLELIADHEPKSYSYIKNFYQKLEHSGISLHEPKTNDVIEIGDGVNLRVLSTANEDIKINLVNNSSLVFQLNSKSKRVLFLGDLGVEAGNKILQNGTLSNLRSTHVQMSHHGQGGVSKEFYSAVNAKIALWPTPIWLWENNLDAKGYNTGTWKTIIVKSWMDEIGISQHIVAGIEGTSQID
ncbi:ComEC/Rec2 family competence protein [Maribacter sp. MAR_2009_72]|uniref:ComEC/Rec2 family competence protein n=1 Tax=Maribacter sp. MAR_2009_72 TaxID=1250050 RepID=UPI001199503D|nr:MBL fold metallo-hydrolase [Maribacter sp. MAR_2009_72]TVZ16176.1 beta-lactamase superfamily II metal-dependent hydrolase [Maribacter sp. MAR_2009_72]